VCHESASLVHDVEVNDVLAPGGEVTALRSVTTETGEYSSALCGIHAGEVSQPPESVGSKNILDRTNVAALSK